MRHIYRVIAIAVVFARTADSQQQQSSAFTVGSATAQRATTATGVIAVPAGSDSALDIPVAVIHGARPGPVVAVHGGDLDENLRPYSYWFRGGRAAQDSAARALIMAFGLDHIIVTDVDPNVGRSLSGQSLARGKTVLVAEAGRSGVVAPADV